MDKGDFTRKTVAIANLVHAFLPQVAFSAVSRIPRYLNAVKQRDNVKRILSIDRDSLSKIKHVDKNVAISYLQTDLQEHIPAQVSVIFPIRKLRKLVADERVCSFCKDSTVKCKTCRRCYGKILE